MYIPKIYQNTNLEEVKSFIKSNSFGILVTHNNGKSHATHIPLELEIKPDGTEVLEAHISKANPQCDHLTNGSEVLCIFNGPHSYISSSWYDFEEVPTWNYVAVHVYGKLNLIEGEALLQAVNRLVNKYEQHSKNPVKLENLSEKTMRQMNGIIGFEIEITDIQAAYKLSQNRDDRNHDTIIEHLNQKDSNSKAVADFMENERTKTHE